MACKVEVSRFYHSDLWENRVSIELGEFCSSGLKTTTEVRVGLIRIVLPRFNPGKEFKRTLENIEFSKN